MIFIWDTDLFYSSKKKGLENLGLTTTFSSYSINLKLQLYNPLDCTSQLQMAHSPNEWNTHVHQPPNPSIILISCPFIIVNCPGWLQFLIQAVCVFVIIPVRMFFGFHILRFITCVICGALFSIACNIVFCLLLHSKTENERIASWITAEPEQNTDIVPRTFTLRTWYCHFYDFFLCLSTINKRNMNSIPEESEPQFPPKEIAVSRNVCMNISCWSGLLNWLWNGFLNKAASSGFYEQGKSGQHI